jgi:hypothetical protein
LSVRSSTRRIHALTTTTSATANLNHQHARDMHLLKHMLFIFVVFVSGWAPIHIFSVIDQGGTSFDTIYVILAILATLSSLIVILDLFWYNYVLRNYLKQRLLNCLHCN